MLIQSIFDSLAYIYIYIIILCKHKSQSQASDSRAYFEVIGSTMMSAVCETPATATTVQQPSTCAVSLRNRARHWRVCMVRLSKKGHLRNQGMDWSPVIQENWNHPFFLRSTIFGDCHFKISLPFHLMEVETAKDLYTRRPTYLWRVCWTSAAWPTLDTRVRCHWVQVGNLWQL